MRNRVWVLEKCWSSALVCHISLEYSTGTYVIVDGDEMDNLADFTFSKSQRT